MKGSDKLKIWCWVVGIIAIAILSVVLFCHIVYWLILIGIFTVVALIVALVVLIWRTKRVLAEERQE